MIGGFRSETATSQENPNGSTGPRRGPAAEKEPNRLHPKAKRLGRCRSFSHAERLTFADRFALRGQPAGARTDPPTFALAIEPNQVIGGAIARVTCGRGGRRRAEDRHRAADRARGA